MSAKQILAPITSSLTGWNQGLAFGFGVLTKVDLSVVANS
jgi:hypothetical protein